MRASEPSARSMSENVPRESEESVFERAVAISSPGERVAFLSEACGNDAKLRERVERLLAAHERAGGFMKAHEQENGSTPTTLASPLTEGPGTRIGRYKLLQVIGEGGMGVVYMAEQTEPVTRRVALKIIKLGMDTRQVVARFEAERQALALMDHPNIARVLDGGATDTGRPYFVMELVQGVPITEFCDKNKLPAKERLKLVIQVCQAIQSAHQKGIIHRDIKPSNVLVTLHHGEPMPKVIDFGIAKATNQKLTEKTLFTNYATMIGTPAYMSPEQAEMSSLDVDTRTDVYALGVLLYELLTGTTPFPEKRLRSLGYGEMQRVILEEEPERPSTRLSTMANEQKTAVARNHGEELGTLSKLLRGDLDWVVMRCLEKDRRRRYDTPNELVADLERHLKHELVVARPPTVIYRFQKMVSRNKLAFAAAAAIAGVLLLGAVVSAWQAIRARHATHMATTESERARKAESRAREDSELANASLYAANMRLAQFAWEQNKSGQVRKLLEETETYPGRGFEWFYWRRQTHLQLQTLRGHRTEVLAVASSPNGQWIATGSQDGTAIVWESASGNPARTLRTHGGAVSSVAFSRDSHRVVTGGWDHTAIVWETATGKLLRPLTGHTAEVFSVAFSPDDQRIVTGSRDHTAKVWDASTGHEQFTLRGHSHWVWSAAFSDNGRWIVTGSQDHTAKVWDATTADELCTFRGHSGPIYNVAVSPTDQRVATASHDLSARVWNAANGEELFPPLKGHSGPIRSVAFSRDGQRLTTGSFDQTAKIWDAASGAELFSVRGHGSPISSVAFSSDAQRLITGGGSIGITPQGTFVFRGIGDSTAKVWTVSGDREIITLSGHTAKVMAAAFSPDGQRIITGSFDKTAMIWDADSRKPVFTIKGHDDTVRAVAFSPDGQRIVTGSLDGTARVWSAASQKALVDLTGHSDKIFSVAFSPDSQRIVTGSADHTARVWSAIDGRQITKLDGHRDWVFSVAFSPDGQWIITGSNDRTAGIWEVATGKRLRVLSGHKLSIMAVAISPDSHRIITGGEDGTARIWDAPTGKELFSLAGHAVEIYSATFSPDGQRVVTAGKDRTAKVWDASNGRELLTLTGHGDEIWSVAFSRDGQRIVTGSWDGTAKVWQAATEDQVLHWRAEEQAASEATEKTEIEQP